jgi:DNA-binding CsgD family transcriptional regulator
MQAASMEHVRARLTPRETDVFVQIGRGMSNKEIARSLGLSVQTVATHRKSISKKLDCNGASLVRLATLAGHVSAS